MFFVSEKSATSEQIAMLKSHAELCLERKILDLAAACWRRFLKEDRTKDPKILAAYCWNIGTSYKQCDQLLLSVEYLNKALQQHVYDPNIENPALISIQLSLAESYLLLIKEDLKYLENYGYICLDLCQKILTNEKNILGLNKGEIMKTGGISWELGRFFKDADYRATIDCLTINIQIMQKFPNEQYDISIEDLENFIDHLSLKSSKCNIS